eukprot:782595-Pyramimonas_sp.AAC.1
MVSLAGRRARAPTWNILGARSSVAVPSTCMPLWAPPKSSRQCNAAAGRPRRRARAPHSPEDLSRLPREPNCPLHEHAA